MSVLHSDHHSSHKLRKKYSQKEWWGIRKVCPGCWCSHCPWRFSRNMDTWHWGMWFSGDGGDGLMVALDYLNGLSNLSDSMILYCTTYCYYYCNIYNNEKYHYNFLYQKVQEKLNAVFAYYIPPTVVSEFQTSTILFKIRLFYALSFPNKSSNLKHKTRILLAHITWKSKERFL